MTQLKTFSREYKTLLVLVLLTAVMCAVSPAFAQRQNLMNILSQASIYGIMACGMTFAIISGDFDLSVGSLMALCGLVAVLLQGYLGLWGALLAALTVSAAVGVVNGLLIARCGMSSFIVTIGMGEILKGIALRISSGKPVASGSAAFNEFTAYRLLGIPVLIVLLLVFLLITWYVLHHTHFGRNVYTIGGNKEVAHNSGIRVVSTRLLVFVLCSVCAGVAGVVNASRLNTAAAGYGDSAALSVITGVVIGGTSLSGGVGGIEKSIVGVLLFNVITNSLDQLGVFSYYQTAIRGALLVAIIASGAYARYRETR